MPQVIGLLDIRSAYEWVGGPTSYHRLFSYGISQKWEMKPRAGFRRTKVLCFFAIIHVTVKMGQILETGRSNKATSTQVIYAMAEDLND